MAEKCGAKARSSGKACTQPVVPGTTRCRFHGGAAPQVRAAGERRLQEARAVEAVATFGLPREIDPRDALLEEVYRTAGAVDWLHKQVQALQPKDVIWGTTKVEDIGAGFPGTNTTEAAAINVWVELWQKERLHLVRVAKEAIAAGIEERKVRLAEQQGALLAGAIRAILGDLDLTPEQQAKVPTVVPRHLRAVATAA